MALADTAKLVVDLSLKGNFTGQIGKATRGLDQLDRKASRGYQIGQQIGTGIQRGALLAASGVGLLAFNVGRGLQSLVDLEAQTDITNAAIKSTGGIAGVTATEIRTMAEQFESVNALFGDEVIQSAANMLLAFTNIRKKAFKPALQAVLDLNAGMGKGPEGLADTAKVLGIALNDPTAGLGRLSRAGVQFTKAQQKRIKGLQAEGKLYEAQAIILAEVNKRFGGRGAAFGGETARKVAKFHDAIEDLQRTLAVGLLPVVGNIADALSDLFADPAIQKGVAEFGQDLGKLITPANIKAFISDVRGIAAALVPAFRAAAGAIGFAIEAFNKLPPDLRNLLVGAIAVNKLTGGLVTNIAGGLAGAIGSALKTIVAGNVTVIGKTVVGPGGLPTPGGTGGAGGGVGKVALGAIGVVGITAAIAEALKGPVNVELKTNFKNPFEGGIGGNIITGLHNLAEVVKLVTRKPPTPTQSPDRQEAAQTRRLQDIAATMVRAVNREGERGRGKAPGASTNTANNIKELANKLSPITANTGNVIPGAISSLQAKTTASIDAMKADTTATLDRANTSITTAQRVGAIGIQSTTRSSALTAAAITAGATRSTGAAIIAAIFAARPVMNVTNVTRSTTIQNRYGPGNGSSGADTGHAPGTGPLP